MNVGYCEKCSAMVWTEHPFAWGYEHSRTTGHAVRTPHDRPEEAALRTPPGKPIA